MGADPGEVVFTSGGTEAANMAIIGALAAQAPAPGRRVICSAVEHAAVRETCHAVARGYARAEGIGALDVAEVRVGPDGVVDLDALDALCDESVALVSVMAVNNETGTIQPIAEVAGRAHRDGGGVIVHTDAVQAVAHLDVAALTADADLVSVSAHKIGGPKGVGALVVRHGVALAPLLHGGGQERERRSGTQDVAGAVGFAVALSLVAAEREREVRRVAALRERLVDGVEAKVDGVVRTVAAGISAPAFAHLRFHGVMREELLVLLDRAGVCASGGAACASGALEPSHVLAAMGVDPLDAGGSIRFTLGRDTTEDLVDGAIPLIADAVGALRDAAPRDDRAGRPG